MGQFRHTFYQKSLLLDLGIEEKLARGRKSKQLSDGFGGVRNSFGDVFCCLGDAYNSLLWGCVQLTAEFSFLPQRCFPPTRAMGDSTGGAGGEQESKEFSYSRGK